MTRSETSSPHVDVNRGTFDQSNRQSAIYPNPTSLKIGSERAPMRDTAGEGRRRFSHVKDLQDQAQTIIRDHGPYMPVGRLGGLERTWYVAVKMLIQ